MRSQPEAGVSEVQDSTAPAQRAPRVQHADPPRRRADQGRPWPVKALTLLLFVQGLGLVVIGVFSVDRSAGLWRLLLETSFYATLPPLGLLALVTTAGFLRLRPGAWVMAMLVQGLTLLVALVFYFRNRPQDPLIYGMMVYALIMVLYLNYAEVPAVFHQHPAPEHPTTEHQAEEEAA